ncbi:hypothetical protein EJB05_37595 [Eragrostis curvula]|uniref:Aldehyde dehydrogenase domain-containing protein n=1 Tax=Eragrostis curvula TaxID=38414 RepID=A0A5J9TTK0_9POAL|nr:hypothetical protein EJB05_37595 [Eragrostis curvula]
MAAPPREIPRRGLFIGGEWKEPTLGRRLPVINPATEATIGDIPAATAEDVELAVAAARDAFSRDGGRQWSRAPGAVRAKFLRAIATKIKDKKSDLALLETLDSGKPLDEANGDMDDVAACFEYYADLAEGLDGKQRSSISLPMENFKSYVLKEPIGVVGMITPWNYPLLMATWKVAPSLAAGCTAVLKPSELASLTCLELGAICVEIGLPPGVLNIITGLGPEAGAPLASHPHVDKIAFTGSTETGKKIMTAAAQIVKPVSLELGGKSPLIVFDDISDIDKGLFFPLILHFAPNLSSVEWAIFGIFFNAGQVCSATSRLLLHEKIAKQFLDRLVAWAKHIKISDPLEEGCRLGSVISEGQVMQMKSITLVEDLMQIWLLYTTEEFFFLVQYEKIKKFISTARSEGATILYGGARPQVRILSHIGISLSGAVISNDPESCERITKAINAGIVWINCSQPTLVQAPWGGNRRSGFGRELGEWGLDSYLTVKQVTQYCSDEPWGWYQPPSKL